jgi:hypothetical protein
MTDAYDLTAPGGIPTGKELSMEQLLLPDERIKLFGGYTVEVLQAALVAVERGMSSAIPAAVRNRLEVSKTLATYGWFKWEFFTISLFWSLTCIEMAMKNKFMECNKDGFTLDREGEREHFEGSFESLEDRLRERWRIQGKKSFNGSFRSLLVWAKESGILPSPDYS